LFLVPITWKSYFFEITTGNKYDEAKWLTLATAYLSKTLPYLPTFMYSTCKDRPQLSWRRPIRPCRCISVRPATRDTAPVAPLSNRSANASGMA
jgi:hypothetical protein